jgi:hypothetical protein
MFAGAAFDAEFATDVRTFFRDSCHLDLTDQQLQTLVAREERATKP